MDFQYVGRNINKLRKIHGWTRSELADRMGITQRLLDSHIMRGCANLYQIARYAEVLNCSIGDLVDDVNHTFNFTFADKYPYNLAIMICDMEIFEDETRIFDLCIPIILGEINQLKSREQEILYMRFHDHSTYDEISQRFCVTRERVRQIELKAIRKLKHSKYRKYYRIDGLLEIIDAKQQLEIENAKLKKELSIPVNQQNAYIDEVEFSIRTYNALCRSGIHTLSEVSELSFDQLRKIRNLGPRSLEEVLSKLREYGFELAETQRG